MICKNCGKELPEGTKFCTGCGAPVEAAPAAAETTAAPAPKPEPVAVPVTPAPAAEDQSASSGSTAVLTGKNHSVKTLAILGAAAIVVLVLLVVLVKSLLGGGGGKAVYVYASDDDELMYLKALKEDAETVELNDDPTQSVRFSKDGKYLYFFTNMDSGSGTSEYGYNPTVDLYRVEVSKIGKKDGDPEKISSDVSYYNTTVLDNGNVLYIRDNQLRYFDGTDSQKLASDVNGFTVNEAQTYAYYTEVDPADYTYTVYRVEIKADGEREKLVSGADQLWSDIDSDVIVYGVQNDDETYDVYSVVPGGDKNRLVRDVTEVLGATAKSGKADFYYLTRQTEEHTLYDFVTDSLEAADNEAANNPQWPSYDDYRSPAPNGYTVTDYDAYNAAYNAVRDAYYAARNRNSMRDYLRNETYNLSSFTLLHYTGEEETKVAEDLDSYPMVEGDVLLYSRRDQKVSKVVNIEDLEYAGQVYDFMGSSEKEWFQNVGGVESSFEAENDMIPSELYLLNDNELVMMAYSDDYEDSALLAYSVGKDALSFTTTITEDEFQSVYVDQDKSGKDVLYYFEEMNKDGDAGDLVRYAGGQKTTLAKEANRVTILTDSGAVFKTDDSKFNDRRSVSEYSLYIVNDSKDSRIADDVSVFVPISAKQVLYISDGDLYVWNGSESTRLARDVKGVWSSERAESTTRYAAGY